MGKWRDLGLRTASAVVLGPLVLAALWLGGFYFTLLLLVATIGLAFEWAALMAARPAGRAGAVARMLAGLFYILLPMAGLAFLRDDAAVGRINTLFLVLLVWATDIGAYVAGRALGGPKLAPAISPGKTITGALGGLAAALAVGIGAWALQGGSIIRALGIAVALSVVAQLGDLGESALKRRLGVKDSGASIPGHGGLFDRLDGLLAAAPLAALLALAAGAGVVLWG
ncbi:MAG: phosphatidate cytidylyltransferase [Rhodospirillales bacterium]|nr:phosphatidate cytidylyltransferase [Rhodospirillales bacterium]